MADIIPELVARIERLEAKAGIDSAGVTVQTVGITPAVTGPATLIAQEPAPDSITRSDATNAPSTVPAPPAGTSADPNATASSTDDKSKAKGKS